MRNTKPTAANAVRSQSRKLKAKTIERLEERRLMSGTTSFDVGINLNGSSDEAFNRAIPILKKLGVDSVRIWCGVSDFNNPRLEGSLKRAVNAHKAGFDVMVIVSTDHGKVPSPSAVKNWFEWAMDNDSLRGAVDRWEIGNEPDLDHYWQGSLKQYVSNFLKPASEVLHARGEQVVSAGVSWDPNDVKEMVSYGMLNYVDYVGFHPYAKGVSLQKTRIAQLEDIIDGRKPLIASEWNVRGYEHSSKSAWADAVESAYKNIKSGFEQNYYFVLFTMDSMAGPAGILNTDGTINRPFYDAFATFAKQASQGNNAGGGNSDNGGADPVVGGTPPSTGNGNGNSSSGVTASLALYNAETDKVISGFSSIGSGDIINLATLPTRKLALVTIASGKAGSVKMTMNGKTVIQSGVPYAFYDDNNGDLKSVSLAPGYYTMAITPYSADDARGTQYATRTIKFTVVNETASGSGSSSSSSSSAKGTPEVESFSLINARTGAVIAGYASISTDLRIDLSDLPTRSLAIRVNADDDTSSVRLSGVGVSRVESNLPYALFGDNNGSFNGWTPEAGSTYTINATAYSQNSARGKKGSAMSIDVTFV